MPLKPNLVERFLINRGIIPGILSDMGLPMFQFFAMIGAMETGFFRYLNEEPADLETLAQKMNASERGLKNLVNALEPMGYVTRKDGKLALTRMAKKMPIDLLEVMASLFSSPDSPNDTTRSPRNQGSTGGRSVWMGARQRRGSGAWVPGLHALAGFRLGR